MTKGHHHVFPMVFFLMSKKPNFEKLGLLDKRNYHYRLLYGSYDPLFSA